MKIDISLKNFLNVSLLAMILSTGKSVSIYFAAPSLIRPIELAKFTIKGLISAAIIDIDLIILAALSISISFMIVKVGITIPSLTNSPITKK